MAGRVPGAAGVAALAILAVGLSRAMGQPSAPLCARAPTGRLCSVLPHDVSGTFLAGYSQLAAEQQRPFDEFSWQSFIALNWPARRDGTPLRRSIRTRRTAPRVWESFPTPREVFGLNGAEGGSAIPRECVRLARGGRLHVFRLTAKNDHVPVETNDFLQATGQPLIDRNLNFAVFDVRLNQEEVDYIRANGLDTFPRNWVWSTFEHVDNAPVAVSPADPTSTTPVPTACAPPPSAGGPFSFFDAACVGCIPNTPPTPGAGETEFLWAASPPFAARYATPGGFGTQMVRCWSIFAETEAVDAAFRQALRGTPWANYRLVGSQWQGGVEDPLTENGNIPRFLSNPSLETYVQGGASCLGCHGAAQTAVGQDANFSFLLRLAALRPASAGSASGAAAR